MTKALATTGGTPPVIGASDWGAMQEMAHTLVKSGFLPKSINTPEKAIAIIITGQELGLGPMQALRSIHIIEGKPTMGAELMMALALKRVPGGYLKIVECTNEQCVVRAGRSKGDTTDYTFTIADAKRAGLLGKSNWKNYPRAMLRSRVISEAVKAVFPDAMIGAYTADELGQETTAEDGGPLVETTPVAVMHDAPVAKLALTAETISKGPAAAIANVTGPTDDVNTFRRYKDDITSCSDGASVRRILDDVQHELDTDEFQELQIVASEHLEFIGDES